MADHLDEDSGYRIFRYPLDITDRQEVKIPYPARLLSVAPSRSNPYTQIDLWAIAIGAGSGGIAPYEKTVGIRIVGTGHPVPNEVSIHDLKAFVGTVVDPSGLVWHVFEVPSK